ncbi:YqzE family protein [Bacillus benzoevorans]|uniref:Protein-arginine kinase n=1 Tax=Bacillus benzoevorans TaxID=1456 RepID=A0A7X0HQI5_9BACI|nr:YqzE family protein [Bacillus benzoevorans]MBB6444901.1 protein-arginine kinase [Bacillus benzoevorans]
MKTNDYVKYITQTVVQYIDQPRDERKKLRQEKKEQRAGFMYRWFGIVPFVFMLQMRERKKLKFKNETE